MVLGLMLFVPATVRAQFSAQPVIVALAAKDSVETAAVTVRNEGEQPLQLRFYMGDFDQNLGGDHSFAAYGNNPHSCKGRTQVFPDAATLLPGETQAVRVSMTPDSLTCWGVLFVEQRARNSSGIMVGQQIAVKIYGVMPDLSASGKIESVLATPDSTGVRVSFEFNNDGKGPVRPIGRVELRTQAGDVITSADVDSYSVLPGHNRRVVVVVPAHLKTGRYVAIPIMDFGADYLAGGQASFRIP